MDDTPKKSRKRKLTPRAEETRAPDIDRLINELLDWHVTKINGDPEEEYFEILLQHDGTAGSIGVKFVMGDFEESKKRLHQQLEERANDITMYAYSYQGRWNNDKGVAGNGAILTFETKESIPFVLGIELVPDLGGKLKFANEPVPLGVAQWSLFHRNKE